MLADAAFGKMVAIEIWRLETDLLTILSEMGKKLEIFAFEFIQG
jgi:hypothetical protein